MGLPWSKLFLIRSGLFGLPENVKKVEVSSVSIDPGEGNLLRTVTFKKRDSYGTGSESECSGELVIERFVGFKRWEPEKLRVDRTLTFQDFVPEGQTKPAKGLPDPEISFSPRPVSQLDAAALKVQKFYKSYRTRRNLADCAVVVEELWWKALDFAALKQSSVSFFNIEKPESAISRWARARTRAAKVGKGLCKDEKAQKLALRHWLEAIDPRHRYGHNLHLYYKVWFDSQSSQPFFYWLDVGDGKEISLEKCPRNILQRQLIEYLGPKEREAYQVIVESGKLVYRQSGSFVDTVEGSKWIFVLSTSRNLYVGRKKKGFFQHSSFLAGGAITAAGRLVAHDGLLQAIWPYSGHYHPTEENFSEFICFLEDHQVNLTNVKRYAIDEDEPPPFMVKTDQEARPESKEMSSAAADVKESVETKKPTMETTTKTTATATATKRLEQNIDNQTFKGKTTQNSLGLNTRMSAARWSNGTGPRIGCVREYPAELQFQVLEQLNLSPKVVMSSCSSFNPIPSPRPDPKVYLSPSLASLNMGLPTPRLLSPVN